MVAWELSGASKRVASEDCRGLGMAGGKGGQGLSSRGKITARSAVAERNARLRSTEGTGEDSFKGRPAFLRKELVERAGRWMRTGRETKTPEDGER